MIKLAKLCTFRFYTPQSCISTDRSIACLGAQPPCVWAGIIIYKIIINQGRTSNLLGCIRVACDTAQYGGLVIVRMSLIDTLYDFMGNKLPYYENISNCLILDKKKFMNGSHVQCIYGNALPLSLYEIHEKK